MHSPRYHVIFDLGSCRPERLADAEGLKQFLLDLVAGVGMHPLIEPVVAEGIPENPGLSGFVIIDYSHCSIHTFTAHGEAMIDIFSCKPYDRDVAKQMCHDYFGQPDSEVREQEVWWESTS